MDTAMIEIDATERTGDGQKVLWTRWGPNDEHEQGTTTLRVAGPVVAAGTRMTRYEWDQLVARCG